MSHPVREPEAIYRLLQRHLDAQAVGFPATRSGADIRLLKLMFTPDEARVGCGLCVPVCPKKAITLTKKAVETVPPADEAELLDTIKANRKEGIAQRGMLLGMVLRRKH
jgi:ferredoxin